MSSVYDRGEEVRWNPVRRYLESRAPGRQWTPIRFAAGGGGSPTGAAGGDLTGTYPNPTIAADAVTDTKLRNSAGLSVIGRSANSIGDPADIVAGSDGDVLRRSGTTLGFGAIPESSVTNLTTDLAAKAPTTRAINTTSPLNGGGNLSADRTLTVDDASTSGKGVVELTNHLGGTATSPTVIGAQETSGPTSLLWGAVADGSFVKRSGTSLVTAALPAAATHTWYDPDGMPSGLSLTSTASDEFMTAQANANFTTTFDPGTISPTKSIVDRGLLVTIPSGGGTTKNAGFVAACPTGVDFIVCAKICLESSKTAFNSIFLALLEANTSTGDFYGVGLRGLTGANQPSMWSGSFTAYNSAAADDFLSGSGPLSEVYAVIRFGNSGSHVTTYLGSSPDNLTIGILDRAWGIAPTKVGIIGWATGTKCRASVPFIRLMSDTYPGATYDFTPKMAGKLFLGS